MNADTDNSSDIDRAADDDFVSDIGVSCLALIIPALVYIALIVLIAYWCAASGTDVDFRLPWAPNIKH